VGRGIGFALEVRQGTASAVPGQGSGNSALAAEVSV
jgi:hypothetical protein